MTAYTLLKGDLLAPDEALRLAWALEDRRFTLQVKGDQLIVRGVGPLTKADRAALRQWKPSLLAIASYQAPEVHIDEQEIS